MHELRRKLNNLKKLQPDTAWEEKQWSLLMKKISQDGAAQFSWSKKIGFIFSHPMLLRPLGDVVVAVLVLAVGSWAALASVQNSMPNHFLYPVKITLEKVELALTTDSRARVAKQTDLAQKRVGELQYLMATAEVPLDSLPVNKTVRNIKQNLQQAQQNLNKLNLDTTENNNFAEMAEEVEKSASKISRSLKETSAKLPSEVQVSVSQELQSTAEEVSDISAQAFDLLIRNWLTDDQIPEEKIQAKINEKVNELNKNYIDLDVKGWLNDNSLNLDDENKELITDIQGKVINLNNDINENFSQIKAKMAEKDYLGVLSLIDKLRQKINNLEKLLNSSVVLGEEEIQDAGNEIDTSVKNSKNEKEMKQNSENITETSTDNIINN